MCPILGPLVPLFWICGDVSSGFQSQSGSALFACFSGHECNVHSLISTSGAQLRIQGGSQGGHGPPLSLLKLVIKKMAAIGGPLYFMFLGPPPPPLTMLDPMLGATSPNLLIAGIAAGHFPTCRGGTWLGATIVPATRL